MRNTLILIVLMTTCLGAAVAEQGSDPWTSFTRAMPFSYAEDLAYYRPDLSLAVAAHDFVQPFGARGMLWDMPETLTVAINQSNIMHSFIGGALVEAFPDPLGQYLGGYLGFSLADLFAFSLPGGTGWLHEEWHRSVLTYRGIFSSDDMNSFPLFRSVISVSHVRDEDLAWLKASYPADFVRLSSAGMEADISFALALKERAFFDRRRFDVDRFQAFLNVCNASLYVFSCAYTDADETLREKDAEEAASVEMRDIVGFDFLSWVYDLHRPGEAYADRGAHASGLGVNRYVKKAQLSRAEQDYLKLQGALSLINVAFGGFDLLLPDRVGLEAFGAPAALSLSVRHYLTSSGFLVDGTLFGRREELKLSLSLRNYFNAVRWMPGAALSLHEAPIAFFGLRLAASLDAAFWMQPEGQSFYSPKADLGGSIRGRLELPIVGGTSLWFEADAKTAGWQAGSVELDSARHLRAGLRLRL